MDIFDRPMTWMALSGPLLSRVRKVETAVPEIHVVTSDSLCNDESDPSPIVKLPSPRHGEIFPIPVRTIYAT